MVRLVASLHKGSVIAAYRIGIFAASFGLETAWMKPDVWELTRDVEDASLNRVCRFAQKIRSLRATASADCGRDHWPVLSSGS